MLDTQSSNLQAVSFRGKCLYGPEKRKPLIMAALDRLPARMPVYKPHDDELILVGSGPSVRNEVEAIRALKRPGRQILAVKGGHDFLMEHDIIPDMAIAVDPQPHTVKYFQRHNPKTIYILASQCPEEMFDLLSERRQCLFHCYGQTTKEALKEWGERSGIKGAHVAVAGGSSSGLRSFNIAYIMGYRRLHIFGMDSCLQPDLERKVNGEVHEKGNELEVVVNGRTFITDPAFAAQACEFQDILEKLSDLKVSFYGDGLLTAIAEGRRENGCEQCLSPVSI